MNEKLVEEKIRRLVPSGMILFRNPVGQRRMKEQDHIKNLNELKKARSIIHGIAQQIAHLSKKTREQDLVEGRKQEAIADTLKSQSSDLAKAIRCYESRFF